MQQERLTLLGATGSIGDNTCAVVAAFPQRFTIKYLTAHRNWEKLLDLSRKFHPQAVALTGISPNVEIEKVFQVIGVDCLWGEEGIAEIASRADVDTVVNAVVGAAGLIPTLTAIAAGKKIALSNKETLVIAGELVMREAKAHNVSILPVDSEHSAIFQCLVGESRTQVNRLILTASGGPFWQRSRESFESITVAEALKHPNWSMGAKITIDSATLMNKGLEVIEASWLFDMPADKIDVVIHPQSIVHSMVEFADGSIKGQLGVPDMKIPIQYALTYPDRLENEICPRLSFAETLNLEFHPPDYEKFKTVKMAFAALKTGGTAPAILNAANEAAVALFLDKKIGFTQIAHYIELALETYSHCLNPKLEDLIQADGWAREFVQKTVTKKY